MIILLHIHLPLEKCNGWIWLFFRWLSRFDLIPLFRCFFSPVSFLLSRSIACDSCLPTFLFTNSS